jgi:hypothetical protein
MIFSQFPQNTYDDFYLVLCNDASPGCPTGTHSFPRVLRCAAKILYEIMLEELLCLTKPSKRAVRGAVLLAPASMQERFCASWHNFYSI